MLNLVLDRHCARGGLRLFLPVLVLVLVNEREQIAVLCVNRSAFWARTDRLLAAVAKVNKIPVDLVAKLEL